MKIIKLNAIDSTNSFLKDLAKNSTLENFTTVISKSQNKGRGQQESIWISEDGKNLLCSVFVRFKTCLITDQVYLNYAVSCAIYITLKKLNASNLSVKWPNDILSDKTKICGILIENSIKNSFITSSVIGIGLNVNQEIFPKELYATSLKMLLGENFDLEKVLALLIDNLKKQISNFVEKKFTFLKQEYLAVLYKKNIPTMFKDSENNIFMGMIVGVSDYGFLQVQLENETMHEFGIKEISFLR